MKEMMMKTVVSPSVPRACLVLAAGVAVLVLGCGRSRLDTIPVSGKVTYKGNPLPWGNVTFMPKNRKECRPALADIKSNGSYQVATLEHDVGLMAGDYMVSVYAPKTPLFVPSDAQKAAAALVTLPTPQRYASPETSGLTVTISPDDGPRTFDIDLTD